MTRFSTWMTLSIMTFVGLCVWHGAVRATSLTGDMAPPDPAQASSPKDNVVKKYVAECRATPPKDTACEKIKKEAIEILKEDVLTLGGSANREVLPTLVTVAKSDEPELRIAVADAIGMIGPTNADVPILARLANDPVPDVRKAVAQTIQRSKAAGLSLLSRRATGLGMQSGRTPQVPPDAGKYSMPIAPESTYLFYASDASSGRLSYVVKKGFDSATKFFKSKAKRGPMKLDEFTSTYKFQLNDEREARQQVSAQANEARSKRMEAVQKDMAQNPQAALEQIMQMQSEMAGHTLQELGDQYQPELFDSPTVYVLEERQIGSRTYPTRYVVLYNDKALRQPGYRLAWMTVPDEAIKTAQVASLKEEQRDLARKKEEAATQKKVEELDALTKKKDEAEKKQFKKGQEDLEKALGF
jgi:HEAT repeats